MKLAYRMIPTLALSLASATFAQEARTRTTTAPAVSKAEQERWATFDPRIIPLKHADSMYVTSTMNGLYKDCYLRPLERSNGVLFVGSDESLARLTKLIDQIDQPEDGAAKDGVEVRMLPVRNRRAEDLLQQLLPVLNRRGTQLAADRDREMIIVRGPKSFIEQVQALVTKLDSPSPTVTLDFSFFGATATKAEEAQPIPPDLQDVVKELQRFGNVRLVGQLATVATENEKFKLEGSVADSYIVSIDGVLESAAPDGSVRIKLNARVVSDKRDANAATQAGPPPRKPAFTLETTVIVKRGTYAALGVAPCGYNDGQSGILVLHVQP